MANTIPSNDEFIALAVKGFFEPARACRQVLMTPKQSEDMVILCLTPEATSEAMWHSATGQAEGSTPIREACIVQNVAARFRRPTEPNVLFFLALLAENVGDVVLYLTYAQYEAKQRGLSRLKMTDFTHIFGDGFWDADDRQRLWNGQKVPPGSPGFNDNLLDNPAVIAWLNAEGDPE